MVQKDTSTERMEEFCYTKKDFIFEWFSGTGPGGQNRNKTQNCVRITHKQSGLSAQSTKHRDRQANQKDAFRQLSEKVATWIQIQIKNKYPRPEKNPDTIRTYHNVENRIKDHSSGTITDFDLDKIDQHLEARLKANGN